MAPRKSSGQAGLLLGEGGRTKVYPAHDTLPDLEMAFTPVNTKSLDVTSPTRIQREAQAMERLSSYQHLVTVVGPGQGSALPCMVTELMGSGDVESLIEKAEDHRAPLERAVNIA